MIKRTTAFLGILACLCFTAMATNRELSIKLDSKNRVHDENCGIAYITFENLNYPSGNNARVRVVIENITVSPPHAILLFRNDTLTENTLKKRKPKIKFEKNYPGKKNNRFVTGCKECKHYVDIITAAETDTVFTIDVPFTSSKSFVLPLYEAKYDAKKLQKKREEGLNGEDEIEYTILEEYVYNVEIEVEGWSENDSTYVGIRNSVENFISSLKGKTFCNNKHHTPSLKRQMRPYEEKKDSLIAVIKSFFDNSYPRWMSTDPPYIAYSKLLDELNSVNLSSYVKDCGGHEGGGREHTCGYCQLSAQDLYHRVDDLYQKLHAGKIKKDQALKAAKGYYICYQKNRKRKKDRSYSDKISRFYNKIAIY